MIRPENLFKDAVIKARNNKWRYITIAIDFHGVLVDSDKYNNALDGKANVQQAIEESIYKVCIRPLQVLSLRKDIKLFLYTSTSLNVKQLISEAFYDLHGIEFDYIQGDQLNVVAIKPGQSFTEKPFCDILFDNCAGFEPEEDWNNVDDIVDNYYILPHKHGDS